MVRRGAIAIVDSPATPRTDPDRERAIDSFLRATVAHINAERPRENRIVLAMFPTPTRETFAEFAAALDCKPHLRSFAQAVFGKSIGVDSAAAIGAGRIFTRFMLAGFATHRALESLRVDAFEGYPYLVFCLWKPAHVRLPPKRECGALAMRLKILDQMVSQAGFGPLAPPSSIDLADATALAMSAEAARANGSILSISHLAEGRLLVPLPQSSAETRVIAGGLVRWPPLCLTRREAKGFKG
jgi:hypothetical protein